MRTFLESIHATQQLNVEQRQRENVGCNVLLEKYSLPEMISFNLLNIILDVRNKLKAWIGIHLDGFSHCDESRIWLFFVCFFKYKTRFFLFLEK